MTLEQRYIRAKRALFDKAYNKLNDMQRQAVFTVNDPLLIIAGAGSGKTTVLINRVAYLIGAKNVHPSQILAITFTNKAANELKERLARLLGDAANDIWASTFHSACSRILRRYGDLLGYTSICFLPPKCAHIPLSVRSKCSLPMLCNRVCRGRYLP